jgi:hypothetical protein
MGNGTSFLIPMGVIICYAQEKIMTNLLRKCYTVCLLLGVVCVLVSKAHSQIIQISPDEELYFGHIPEGKVAVRTLSIFNLSSTALAISELRIEGVNLSSFSIINNPVPVTLGLLQKLILEVQFLPDSEGDFSASFVVVSNASSSPDRVDLKGIGTDLDGGFISFERIFGGPYGDGASSVRATTDGGFILAGSTVPVDADYSDATLIKTDRYGQIEWKQIYGLEEWSEGFAEAVPTPDGGYIAVGSKAHSEKFEPPDIWVVKTDGSGSITWEKTIGDKETDECSDVILTGNGGYLVAGSFQHDTAQRQDVDAYLIKLNSSGTIEWEKKYGGTGGDKAGSVRQTTDGGYAFVGYTDSYGAGIYDVYLVKLNAAGDEQWYKTYGGTDWDISGKMVITNDNGFLLAGWTANFGARARDIYLVKTDANGNEQWHKIYGDAHKDGASDIIATNDGGYLVVGGLENTYFSNEWRTDLYILKIDASGNKLWDKTFGDYNDEGASCIREVSDGGFIISGGANSYGNSSEVYLLKIDRLGGFSSVSSNFEVTPQEFQLEQNYPNPFNNKTRIKYHLPKNSFVQLKIYNIQGQLISTMVNQYQGSGSYNVAFTAKDLPSGFYFYQLKLDNFSDTKRMLLLK